jgi:hypothetical protein
MLTGVFLTGVPPCLFKQLWVVNRHRRLWLSQLSALPQVGTREGSCRIASWSCSSLTLPSSQRSSTLRTSLFCKARTQLSGTAWHLLLMTPPSRQQAPQSQISMHMRTLQQMLRRLRRHHILFRQGYVAFLMSFLQAVVQYLVIHVSLVVTSDG